MAEDRALSLREFLNKDFKEDLSQQIIGNGVLNKGSVLMVVGPPKCYKSFMLNTISVELALGKPLFGTRKATKHGGHEYKLLVHTPQRVLILEQEVGEYDIYMRMKPLIDSLPPEHQSQAAENIWFVSQDYYALLDRQSGMDRIRRYVDQVKPNVLAFDPFRNFHLLKETDETDMTKIMHNLQLLRMNYNLSQVMIHHSPKASMLQRSGLDLVRGSSAIAAAIDSAIIVSPDSRKVPRVKLEYIIRRGSPLGNNYIQLNTDSLRMYHVGWEADSAMKKLRKKEEKDELVEDLSDGDYEGTIQ